MNCGTLQENAVIFCNQCKEKLGEPISEEEKELIEKQNKKILKKSYKKSKVLSLVLFPIIMTLLFLILPFLNVSSHLKSIENGYFDWIGFWAALGVYSIPFARFLIVTYLGISNKLKPFTANIWTAIWLAICLPLTWYIAVLINQYVVYLGVELLF